MVKIEMQDGSVIKAELYPDIAPKTVSNFVKLVNDGFYDGLIFHRVIDGFMIQGGDPEGTGTGGSDETISGEFSSNGVNNPLSHTKGILSMARSNDPDSASSQFFICVADSEYLDGEYAAFGKVVEGMDVAEKIAKVEKDDNDKPLKDVVMKKVTIED
ncbi:MAG: peptidylprolyl isomerase [Clostridiales Family XIII bacterium]|nr:peptidylprolyl isomerase [Clostridiales Family XIII bacterium]